MRARFVVAGVLLAIAIVAAVAFRMHGAHALPDLAGDWASWRSKFRISHDGDDGYTVVVTNPNGFLGGTYTATPRGSVLALRGPLAALCGQIEYVKDEDKLQFCGEEFQRAQPGSGAAAAPARASNHE
jgi:hypothetical protein